MSVPDKMSLDRYSLYCLFNSYRQHVKNRNNDKD